jgi:DUF2889 family protein
VHVVAQARDIWTGIGRDHEIVGEAGVEAVVAFVENRSLRSITVDPPAPLLDELVGVRVSSGFRKAIDEVIPADEGSGSLRYQLLDDLPTAVLVSGVAMAGAGLFPSRGSIDMSSRADICAGWATGGTFLVEGERLGHLPNVTGPIAPGLQTPDDDALAWHPVGEMTPHSTRRRRRIDVWRDANSRAGAGSVVVEEFFRDTLVDGDGVETVVHEYLVEAELEPDSLTFLSCRADIGVLPWVECPAAAGSAERLNGTKPGDLRERVRETFVGTSTCTHLNDSLRAFAALPYLVSVVDAGGRIRR